jgi:hypothetical protein
MRLVTSLVSATSLVLISAPLASAQGWKAGTARAAITPRDAMWMAGYAARNRPSEGAVHDLWAKALALQDPGGRKAVLVTLDVCGIGRDLSTTIRDGIQARHALAREQVVLACSHTHCGPVVGTNLITMYKIDDSQREKIKDYARFLAQVVGEVVDAAMSGLEPAQLAWETGRCDFAVNRRNNKEKDVPELRSKLALVGPVDHDVPVLRVRGPGGKVLAVVFGYACHCTVLDFLKFCGDYAGFAQIAIEGKNPGAQAMFVAGCGGDQNPIPRRSLDLAEAYGKQLADAVARVLAAPMRPIEGPLRPGYQEIDLAFGPLPSREQVEKDAASSDFYVASRARHLLERFKTNGKLPGDYPYPVQAWGLDELTWVFFGGEATVDYALRIKRNLGGSHTWVSAYCNDVMAYIPSLRVLKEGGYEGATSMIYYGQPTVWSERVEEDLIAAVNRVLGAINPAPPAAVRP